MSPSPLAQVAWRRKDGKIATSIGEREFLTRVQTSEGFWKSMTNLSKASGMEVDALEVHAEEICRSVWAEADIVMASDGPVAAAREEVSRLKRKLVDCNLSAMKQMLASKSNSECSGAFGDDTLTFHEPLQYLDQESKDLVMDIVCDKMRQLENNTAPPSLVQALVHHAQAQATCTETASMEELKEAKAQLEDARVELRKARARMEEAEEASRKFEARLQVAEERATRFEEELKVTKAKLEETEQTLATLRVEHAKLQKLTTEQKATIERQNRELDYERRCNKELRAEVERLQEYVHKAEQLEKELNELQAQFDVLEKEANQMRAELARRNNTRTQGTQTTLTGSKMDDQSAETRKMKLMLEELQTKLKELMTEYRRKFGDAATKIAEGLGLKELLKEETVFQRLYDDALDRVHRLEQLRAKVKKDRQGLTGESCTAPDVPIMQAVEEAQPTTAMRALVQDRSPQRPEQHSFAGGTTGSDDVWERLQKIGKGYPVMKSSTSLPSLSKPEQHITMLNLNLGTGKRGSKMRKFF